MSEQAETATAARIRKMAQECHVAYVGTQSDALAHHITRLRACDAWPAQRKPTKPPSAS